MREARLRLLALKYRVLYTLYGLQSPDMGHLAETRIEPNFYTRPCSHGPHGLRGARARVV